MSGHHVLRSRGRIRSRTPVLGSASLAKELLFISTSTVARKREDRDANRIEEVADKLYWGGRRGAAATHLRLRPSDLHGKQHHL
ncbi:hypothetical protein QYE76_070532 [Lolium multiflorum]|uniref:Uncharacterized protein n=1 Tax=Lolium multiflorum TaxID=4521 RepID=A0AAD8WFY6_LOLMU|nr:hypothetical protein QYE76_070532 [Lolium multiflorum]